MKTIAIIILNWNTADLTQTTISSFLKIKPINYNFHIVLVDNGSSPECIADLDQKFSKNKQITILKSPINTGYAQGNNIGISWALKHNYQYLMIANSDIRVSPNFLNILYSKISKSPKLFLAPKIYFEKGFEFHKQRYKPAELGKVLWSMGGQLDWNNIYGSNIAIDEVDRGQYDHNPPSPDFISGCCFLVSRQLFEEIGLFDPKYYLYMEDSDLSIRAQKHGYILRVIPQAKIWHINSGSAAPSSNIQDYFLSRNRLLFSFDYASLRTKFAIFRESIRLLLTGRPWQKLGIRDFYLRNFGKGSWR